MAESVSKANSRQSLNHVFLVEKKMGKMWYVYTMELQSAIEKNEITLFPWKWIKLVVITLKERSLTQKGRRHIFSHMQNLHFKNCHETERRPLGKSTGTLHGRGEIMRGIWTKDILRFHEHIIINPMLLCQLKRKEGRKIELVYAWPNTSV